MGGSNGGEIVNARKILSNADFLLYFKRINKSIKLVFWKMVCDLCENATHLRRSRRNTLERLISLFVLPYRCEKCDLRMFKLRWLNIPQTHIE